VAARATTEVERPVAAATMAAKNIPDLDMIHSSTLRQAIAECCDCLAGNSILAERNGGTKLGWNLGILAWRPLERHGKGGYLAEA
jgi:hypothetical protein